MKLVIPKQHGAWYACYSFFIKCRTWETYYLSYSIVFSVVFIYLATYPFLTYIKQRRKKSFYKLPLFISALRSYLG